MEALRCFKCDLEGVAIICRIKLNDKNMNIKDLVGKGLLTNIETLDREKDRSVVVFIEGRSCVPQPPKGARIPRLLLTRRNVQTPNKLQKAEE